MHVVRTMTGVALHEIVEIAVTERIDLVYMTGVADNIGRGESITFRNTVDPNCCPFFEERLRYSTYRSQPLTSGAIVRILTAFHRFKLPAFELAMHWHR